GDTRASEQMMRQAIEIRPKRKGYHLALGILLRSQGRNQEALEALQTEVALNPTSEPAQRLLREMAALLSDQKVPSPPETPPH
ncbi:MAG TPA: hypothetical protein VIC04_07225, partial [Terriglobia bacterium]